MWRLPSCHVRLKMDSFSVTVITLSSLASRYSSFGKTIERPSLLRLQSLRQTAKVWPPISEPGYTAWSSLGNFLEILTKSLIFASGRDVSSLQPVRGWIMFPVRASKPPFLIQPDLIILLAEAGKLNLNRAQLAKRIDHALVVEVSTLIQFPWTWALAGETEILNRLYAIGSICWERG